MKEQRVSVKFYYKPVSSLGNLSIGGGMVRENGGELWETQEVRPRSWIIIYLLEMAGLLNNLVLCCSHFISIIKIRK